VSKLNILFDKETAVEQSIAGAAADVLIALDLTHDPERVLRGDIELVLDIQTYTSGDFTVELVTADNAALSTNPVVEATYRTLTAAEILVVPVPQSVTNDKDFVGLRLVAEAHEGDVVAHAQSLQLRNMGR